MTAVRKKNSGLHVLGLSATPVVNNLTEGRSLLELITGKIYDDISTRSTIPNAVTLYEKLSTTSIMEIPVYGTHVVDRDIIEVATFADAVLPVSEVKSTAFFLCLASCAYIF
jgi:hypothetical protein